MHEPELCQFCGRPAYKTDGLSRTICQRYAETGNCKGFTPRTVERRPGRNHQCPCGSGKKYKRCCGAAAPASVIDMTPAGGPDLCKPVEDLRNAINKEIVADIIRQAANR